ncbi:hypothetical protein CEUSTIGMA_g556.t1 [Chlamydomonas eustigma]|uniref:Protein ZIP4 homolog n=1 Tax=Chlamydomonas eustigma TaxID=1157962 RepID=A0A250WQK7_9CHLO|nr:hypothetical protein CEUSTIGMA_g556.t1 [Chlamydomonas eustigma]|eukprot:GAX73103.1 hypothetical protein CEUSTIGMA_g556.t1 [Chlamydomonas eustigma]
MSLHFCKTLCLKLYIRAEDLLKSMEMVEAKESSCTALATAQEDGQDVPAQQAVLQWLMYCHVHVGDFHKAVACYDKLTSGFSESNKEGQCAVHALYIVTLAKQSKLNEAACELLTLAANDAATMKLCFEVVSELQATGMELEALKNAVGILKDRCKEEDGGFRQLKVAVSFAAMIALDNIRIEREGDLVDRILLDCARDGKSHFQDTANEAAPTLSASMRVLLWNQAVHCFKSKQWERASPLFEASIHVSASSEQESEAHRSLALCCLGRNQLQQALMHLDDAESCLQKSAAIASGMAALVFVRLKIYLDLGDVEAATAQVQRACKCEDFSPCILEVMCQEAVKAGQYSVAVHVLVRLHEHMVQCKGDLAQEPDGGQEQQPGTLTEASVLRSLIMCIITGIRQRRLSAVPAEKSNMNSQKGVQAANSDAPASIISHAVLAKYLLLASNRLKEVGFKVFFGQESGESRALDWLCAKAWAQALEAADAGDMQSSSVMLVAYATFLSMQPVQLQKHLQGQKIAYLMTAVSAIEVHKDNPDHTGSLMLASNMIKAVRDLKKEQSMDSSPWMSSGVINDQQPPSTKMDQDEAFMAILEFVIAIRLKDQASIELLLSETLPLAASTCPPSKMLELVEECRGEGFVNDRALKGCQVIALHRLMAESEPDLQAVSKILCSLINASEDDEERLRLYKEAATIFTSCQSAKHAIEDTDKLYPELHWLITTAWNRGIHNVRFSRFELAKVYMQAAMRMLPMCPILATNHIKSMETALVKVSSMI